jgi:hypothetical protein
LARELEKLEEEYQDRRGEVESVAEAIQETQELEPKGA